MSPEHVRADHCDCEFCTGTCRPERQDAASYAVGLVILLLAPVLGPILRWWYPLGPLPEPVQEESCDLEPESTSSLLPR